MEMVSDGETGGPDSRADDICDAELLARSASGDRRAFDRIVARYGPLALRLAARIAPDRHSAEDIAQEAMVRIWHRAADFDSHRARFTTWLYRIVVNLCIDLRRRPAPVPLPEDFDAPDPAAAAEQALEQEECRTALYRAMDDLTAGQRAALTLVYDEGLSGAEAAQVLGVTTKAVERLLARARAHLRERLLTDSDGAEART
jgi:RNA polymerase sigma-70 factor (ECF subfamily)